MQSKWLPKLSLLLTGMNFLPEARMMRNRMQRLKETMTLTIAFKFLVLLDKISSLLIKLLTLICLNYCKEFYIKYQLGRLFSFYKVCKR